MENEVCDICDGEKMVEIMSSYRDDAGVIQLEGTGKFKPCPECNESTESHDELDQDR